MMPCNPSASQTTRIPDLKINRNAQCTNEFGSASSSEEDEHTRRALFGLLPETDLNSLHFTVDGSVPPVCISIIDVDNDVYFCIYPFTIYINSA